MSLSLTDINVWIIDEHEHYLNDFSLSPPIFFSFPFPLLLSHSQNAFFCVKIFLFWERLLAINICLPSEHSAWSFSPFPSLPRPLCLSVNLSFFTSLCPSVCLSTSVSLSLILSPPFVWLHTSLSLTHSFHCLSVSLSICLSGSLSLSLPFPLSPSLSTCLPISVCFSLLHIHTDIKTSRLSLSHRVWHFAVA